MGRFDTQETLRDQIVYQMGAAFASAYQEHEPIRTYLNVITSDKRAGEFVNVQDLYQTAVSMALDRAGVTPDTLYAKFQAEAGTPAEGWIAKAGQVFKGIAADMSLNNILRNDELAPPSLRFTSAVDHVWDVINVGLTMVDGVGLAIKAPKLFNAGVDAAKAAGRLGLDSLRGWGGIDALNVGLKARLGDLAAGMFRTDGTSMAGRLSDAVALQLSKHLPSTPSGGVGELLGRNYDLREGATIITSPAKSIPVTGRESLIKIATDTGFDWVSFTGRGEDAQLYLNDAKMYYKSKLDKAGTFNVGNKNDNFGAAVNELRDTVESPEFRLQHGEATQRALLNQLRNNAFEVRLFMPQATRVNPSLSQRIMDATGARNVSHIRF